MFYASLLSPREPLSSSEVVEAASEDKEGMEVATEVIEVAMVAMEVTVVMADQSIVSRKRLVSPRMTPLCLHVGRDLLRQTHPTLDMEVTATVMVDTGAMEATVDTAVMEDTADMVTDTMEDMATTTVKPFKEPTLFLMSTINKVFLYNRFVILNLAK